MSVMANLHKVVENATVVNVCCTRHTTVDATITAYFNVITDISVATRCELHPTVRSFLEVAGISSDG